MMSNPRNTGRSDTARKARQSEQDARHDAGGTEDVSSYPLGEECVPEPAAAGKQFGPYLIQASPDFTGELTGVRFAMGVAATGKALDALECLDAGCRVFNEPTGEQLGELELRTALEREKESLNRVEEWDDVRVELGGD